MTDKEKIRAEIERRIDVINNRENKIPADKATLVQLTKLLSFIDSMQEEPKFKVGDTIKSSDAEEVIVCEVRDNEYLCDEGKNYCIVPFNKQDQWKIVEYPVSEDLDSFAIKYAQDKPYPVTVCQAVKVGANWQKQNDEKTLNENALLYNARL